jgi:methanogenic corrinoid protein MtbC1
MNSIEVTSKQLERALIELNEELAESIVLKTIETAQPIEMAGSLISETLTRIGDSWEQGELALSQVYMSSLICEKIVDKILPPQSPNRKNQPKTAIGVFEDFHLLGKRIVYSTLRASGIELMDLGGGLTIEKVVNIVKNEQIKILLLSVLMLPSALRIKELIRQLADVNVKVVVGGAPFRFDDQLSKEIGAHYYGKDSAEALQIVNKLMEGRL